MKPFRNLRTIVPGFVRAKNNTIPSKNSRAPPHQREASWTAVVLYRFLVGQSIPVNRAGWKPKRWNPLTGTVRASAIRLRGGNILVEDSEVPHGLPLN